MRAGPPPGPRSGPLAPVGARGWRNPETRPYGRPAFGQLPKEERGLELSNLLGDEAENRGLHPSVFWLARAPTRASGLIRGDLRVELGHFPARVAFVAPEGFSVPAVRGGPELPRLAIVVPAVPVLAVLVLAALALAALALAALALAVLALAVLALAVLASLPAVGCDDEVSKRNDGGRVPSDGGFFGAPARRRIRARSLPKGGLEGLGVPGPKRAGQRKFAIAFVAVFAGRSERDDERAPVEARADRSRGPGGCGPRRALSARATRAAPARSGSARSSEARVRANEAVEVGREIFVVPVRGQRIGELGNRAAGPPKEGARAALPWSFARGPGGTELVTAHRLEGLGHSVGGVADEIFVVREQEIMGIRLRLHGCRGWSRRISASKESPFLLNAGAARAEALQCRRPPEAKPKASAPGSPELGLWPALAGRFKDSRRARTML
jgi:hypothetical protein